MSPYAVRIIPITYRNRDLKRSIEMQIVTAMDRETAEIKRLFESTVATWEHQVKFTVLEKRTASGRMTAVGTNDLVYAYVDGGTRAHLIFPKNAKALAFQPHYQAKTTPGVIGSGAGGASGDVVFSKGVIHPGTKARGFSKAIEAYWGTRFDRNMQEAINRAVR